MTLCDGKFRRCRGGILPDAVPLFFLCPIAASPLNPQPQDFNQGPQARISRNILSRLQRGVCCLFPGGGEKAFKINVVTKLQKLHAIGAHVRARARARSADSKNLSNCYLSTVYSMFSKSYAVTNG